MKSKYKLNDLLRDCNVGTSKVFVLDMAMRTARLDFNLQTQPEVLGFISNGGLEAPQLINSKKWENNPISDSLIMVDAYGFYSGIKYGYIAFFYQPKTEKWNIKSFKKIVSRT